MYIFTFTAKFVQIRYLGEVVRLITSSAGEKTEKIMALHSKRSRNDASR